MPVCVRARVRVCVPAPSCPPGLARPGAPTRPPTHPHHCSRLVCVCASVCVCVLVCVRACVCAYVCARVRVRAPGCTHPPARLLQAQQLVVVGRLLPGRHGLGLRQLGAQGLAVMVMRSGAGRAGGGGRAGFGVLGLRGIRAGTRLLDRVGQRRPGRAGGRGRGWGMAGAHDGGGGRAQGTLKA